MPNHSNSTVVSGKRRSRTRWRTRLGLLLYVTGGIGLLPTCATADSPVPATTRLLQRVREADGSYGRRLITAAVPEIGDHEVLLHVRAISIQRGDAERMVLPADWTGRDRNGLTMGSDAAGDIVRTGRHVHSLRPGARVLTSAFESYLDHPLHAGVLDDALGFSVNGVFGDYVVLKETAVVPMPQYLSYEEAATLPSSALTAWSALGIDERRIHRGDTVLVEGTGAISTFALQFSVAAGAQVVVTSSSEDKLQKARSLGASALINYRKVPDWSAEVLRQTRGHGADLVVDIGGRSTLEQSMKSLAYEGTLAVVGGLGGYDGILAAWPLMEKSATARGVFGGSRSDLERMCQFMARHRIHPVIGRTYAFDDIDQAMKDALSGEHVGKLVVKLQE